MGLDATWGQVGHGDIVNRHSSLEPGTGEGDGTWCQSGTDTPWTSLSLPYVAAAQW